MKVKIEKEYDGYWSILNDQQEVIARIEKYEFLGNTEKRLYVKDKMVGRIKKQDEVQGMLEEFFERNKKLMFALEEQIKNVEKDLKIVNSVISITALEMKIEEKKDDLERLKQYDLM